MKHTQEELTKWAISQIKDKNKDNIALLIAVKGHSMENDCHGECFDYFIPKNAEGNKLAKTFIIDGVGYDLYPRSWGRIENMANFTDDFSNGLDGGIILYYASEEDKNKFIAMQEKQRTNLNDKEFMYKKALEKLEVAMDIYRTLMFEDKPYKVFMASGFIARYLSMAVAYINGTYFKQRLDLETLELKGMKEIPKDFINIYNDIVRSKTAKELKELCYGLISTTRQFISAHKIIKEEADKQADYENLADWYEEGSLIWRRIYYNCDEKDYKRVFVDAISLQHELTIIKEEFNLKEMDLLGSFDFENLEVFKQRALELEQYIVFEIENHGVKINKYDTLEQFLEANK